jgi:uncharacterized repeat protein (TIGR03806 family)
MCKSRVDIYWRKGACMMALLFSHACISEDDMEPKLTFHKLSDYGFFQGDISSLQPTQKVIPYELVNPLFTDYAEKDRFIYIPEGQASYRSDEVFTFPLGTAFIKNFSYTAPSGELFRVETRLLRRTTMGWEADTYLWNRDQSEAILHKSGKSVDLTFRRVNGDLVDITYLVPDKNQCKSCHSVFGEIKLIGPKARNLNLELNNGKNQLAYWEDIGILLRLPELSQIPKIEQTTNENATIDIRARAYLDINCGHCHNSAGSARNSGLFLNYGEGDSFRLGFCKLPIAAGPGTGGLKHVITPGSALESILWFRMNTSGPAARMPELGRTLIDEKGVELIRKWIDNMSTESCIG